MSILNEKKCIKIIGLCATTLILITINTASVAEEKSHTALTNQLLQKLIERDKVIANLQERVKQLENRVGIGSPHSTHKTRPSKKTRKQKTHTASAKSKSSAGSFEVDEIAAERALSRTLVQTGALLLPFGQAEIQPFTTYARRETNSLELVQTTSTNTFSLNKKTRRNEINAGLFFRFGLPFETQAELRLPTRIVNESQIREIPGRNNIDVADNTGFALGDISIGLAKTLMHESDWMPDLIGRITWDTDSGKFKDNKVNMGTGFNDLIVSVTALKRQDPLAFTGTVSYQRTFKKFGIDPGNKFSFAMGATLAASPQTSLSIGLQQTFAQELRVNGVPIIGSDTTQSLFTFGAASTIGRRLFFSVTAGIGLTDSSPDYFVNVAVPLRFDIPFKSLSNF